MRRPLRLLACVFLLGLSPARAEVLPQIISFAVVPATVRPGQAATLAWITRGAASVMIDNGVGVQPAAGAVTVVPTQRTTYTLTVATTTQSASASVAVSVLTAPSLVVHATPQPIVQPEGTTGGRTTYVVSNVGGTATSVTLFNAGNFFSQDPAFFTLAPGSSQTVTVTANTATAGAYDGASLVNATGLPDQLQVPVKVASLPQPAGTVTARPLANRVDIAAQLGAVPTGSATFANDGDTTLVGALASDAPWLIPQSGLVRIDPGRTATVNFTVDQSKVYQADFGSVTATLSLRYLTGSGAPAASAVSVVDTIPVVVSNQPLPPMTLGDVMLFVPGAGHAAGTVGTFITDLSVMGTPGSASFADARLIYTSVDGKTNASAGLPVFAGGAVNLADVVQSVFRRDAEIGTLQIRSPAAASLLTSARVFNISRPSGTFGTAIPVFRSDRAAAIGEKVVLTGLRKDATSHTNLFIQETNGLPANVTTEFFAADGTSLGTRTDAIGPFGVAQINNAAPPNAAYAELTNVSTLVAKFLAYATPVDDASGDNWSVVDWSRQYGYSGRDPMVVPVAGFLNGANDTHFKTDLSITNTSTTTGTATLRYIARSGNIGDRPISLGPRQSTLIRNVVGDLFGGPSGSVGFLILTPSSGTFAMTSRTYTTVADQPATFGTGVPTIPQSASIQKGATLAIGGIEDSSVATVVSGRGATYRTNFGLVETTGNPVRVRVTLTYNYIAGIRHQTSGSAAKDYILNPYQFLLLNGIASEVLGPSVFTTLGDLHGLQAFFQVIDGDGAVAVFTSTVDNGTGDSVLRME